MGQFGLLRNVIVKELDMLYGLGKGGYTAGFNVIYIYLIVITLIDAGWLRGGRIWMYAAWWMQK